MKGLNKAVNLFAITLLFAANAQATISWDDAKTQVIKKAETVIKDYDKELCTTTLPMYETITSEGNEEAWDIVKEIIDKVADSAIYKKAYDNPTDTILWSELIIQASMLVGQKIAATAEKDMMKVMALSMKTGAIIGTYFEVLKDDLKA